MYSPHEVGIYAAVVVFLVIGAGLMSGLTLGLLSLDVLDLEVGARSPRCPQMLQVDRRLKYVWANINQQHNVTVFKSHLFRSRIDPFRKT